MSCCRSIAWRHGLQHARLPCPPPSPRAYHPCLSSSVLSFSSCPQSFPASGSFPVSQLFASGGQSFSFSISPSYEYSGLMSFRIDWFDLAVQGTLKSLLQHRHSKALILQCSAFFIVQLSHPYMTTGKTIALTRWTFVSKVMSLLFNVLSRFIIAFLPRSKHFLISWLQSPSAVILEHRKIKSATVSTFPPSISQEAMGPYAMILVFRCWVLSLLFHSPLSPLSRGSLVPFRFVLLECTCHMDMWGCWYFSRQSWCLLVTHPAWHFTWCTLHKVKSARWQYTALMFSFLSFEPVHCSMSTSNCCFLSRIQVSQETGKVVWYSHLFKNFPQFIMIHTVKGFSIVNEV